MAGSCLAVSTICRHSSSFLWLSRFYFFPQRRARCADCFSAFEERALAIKRENRLASHHTEDGARWRHAHIQSKYKTPGKRIKSVPAFAHARSAHTARGRGRLSLLYVSSSVSPLPPPYCFSGVCGALTSPLGSLRRGIKMQIAPRTRRV